MAEDKGNVVIFTKISKPIPGEHAFGRDNEIFSEWLDGIEEDIWACFHIAMKHRLSLLIKDTQIHFCGVKIDSAIKVVLFGVKSHVKVSFF